MSEQQIVGVPSVEDMAARIAANLQRMGEDPEFRAALDNPHPSGNPMTLGPRLPTADEWADLQVKGSTDNAQKWLDRTTKPKKNFKEEALRPTAVQRYKDSMARVIAEDRQRGGMELVDEGETIAIVAAGGTGAYTTGVNKRKAKIRRRVGELREARLALCVEVDGMSVATDGDREAKMIANLHGLKAIGAARRSV